MTDDENEYLSLMYGIEDGDIEEGTETDTEVKVDLGPPPAGASVEFRAIYEVLRQMKLRDDAKERRIRRLETRLRWLDRQLNKVTSELREAQREIDNKLDRRDL